MRADLILVERGLATTRSQAQRLIASGVHWRVDADAAWKKVAKNGDEIPEAADIQVPDTTEAKYISRGGLKLEGALLRTGLSVQGLRCLDVGQSTGGFTDCLLQHGASQVLGVDVGHGQLHPTLRAHAQVVCIEGVNARSLTADDLLEHYRRSVMLKHAPAPLPVGDDEDEDEGDKAKPWFTKSEAELDAQAEAAFEAEFDSDFSPLFDFLTGDLSFISLTLVLPAVVRLLKPGGQALMLVKPQFELQPGQIGKGGIVRDPVHFAFVEKRLRDCCAELGLDVQAWLDSPIEGGDGNREFFISATKSLHSVGEDKPLAAAPARQSAKRVPRSATRSLLDQLEQDGQAEHAGQPGPARRRGKKTDASD